MKNSWGFVIALILFAGAIALRLYDLTDQPIDFHSTRQLRGAIIARGMYYEMLPGADESLRQMAVAFWRSTGQYEPSILELLVALTYLMVGGEYFWIARIINTFLWAIGGLALFALARRMANNWFASRTPSTSDVSGAATFSALIATGYYFFLPFAVQASRSFQPDPGMVVWLLLFCYCIYRWSEEPAWKWAICAGLCGGLAVLTKAIALYTIAGIGISLVLYSTGFTKQGFSRALRNPQLWCLAGLILAPPAIYSLFLGSARAAEYFTSWTLALSHLLLQPSLYLRWLLLVQNLMTPLALVLAAAGVILSRALNRAFLLGMWCGYFIYGLFFPYQMYSHNYYHLQVVILVAFSLVPFLCWLYVKLVSWKTGWRYSLASALLIVLVYFIWSALLPMRSQDYRGEPVYWQRIASYLPTDGKIIALTQDYGYRLMYYGWRKVSLWPNRGEQNLNALRGSQKEFTAFFDRLTADKSYFLITSFRQFDDQPQLKQYLFEHFPIMAQGNGYLIFSLTGS